MFRGQGVKGIVDTPDVMRGKVACVQCHVGVKRDKAETTATLKAACAGCHEKEYGSLVDEWMARNKKLTESNAASAAALEKELSDFEKQQGRHSVPLRARYDEISHDMRFLAKGGWQHNPQYGEAIAAKITRDSGSLLSMMKTGVAGRAMIIKK
jgi:cytochrome c553